jgi:foldase protein PrsA
MGMKLDISIEKDLIMGKFVDSLSRDITVSDKEIEDYYDKNLQAFTTPEQLRLSIIKVDNIDEAKKIKKEIEKGADFEEMANKYPAGHGEPGVVGETNWVTLDTFPPDMVKEIKRIRAGTFGGPIKGREGYYIIKVQEKIEKKVQPFDEVKENIRNILIKQKRGERFQSWLQDARGKAKTEILQKG